MAEIATIAARRPFHRRRKTCPFSGDKAIKRSRFIGLLPYVIK